MKPRYISILLILLVAAVLAVSGCSGSNTTTTPTATPVPGTATATLAPGATTTPTQAPASGTAGTLGSLYKSGQFHWYEYQMTTNAGGQTMTQKAKTELLGQAADPKDGVVGEHMRVTSTTIIPGMDPVVNAMDFYSKPGDSSGSSKSTDYTKSDAKLVNEGADTVTVPAGTFACTKYSVTMSSSDGPATNTFWSSSQVPVPVKFTAAANGDTVAFELTGWG